MDLPTLVETDAAGDRSYWIAISPEAEIAWRIRAFSGTLSMQFGGRGAGLEQIEGLEVIFPFAPEVTPVAAIGGTWNEDGSFILPAIISAPDFGQMLLTVRSSDPLRNGVLSARLDGNRSPDKWTNLVLELAPPQAAKLDTMTFRRMFCRRLRGSRLLEDGRDRRVDPRRAHRSQAGRAVRLGLRGPGHENSPCCCNDLPTTSDRTLQRSQSELATVNAAGAQSGHLGQIGPKPGCVTRDSSLSRDLQGCQEYYAQSKISFGWHFSSSNAVHRANRAEHVATIQPARQTGQTAV